MDVIGAIKKRKSIRGFTQNPVNKSVLREILAISTRAPSGLNAQPWEFTVITDDVLENIREENVQMFRAGELPKLEHPIVTWPKDSIYRRRQVELAMRLFNLMGVAREDKKRESSGRNGGCAILTHL